MPDLRSRLDELADRGDPLGAAEVWRRAKKQIDEGNPSVTVPLSLAEADRPRPVRRRAVAGAVVVAAIVAAVAFAAADRGTHKHVIVARPTTTKQALATQQSARLFWVDGHGVAEGDPKTGRQARLGPATAAAACETCAGVQRIGRYVFLTQPRILRVDTTDGRVKDVGPGLFVFPNPDGQSLYVVLSEESTPSTTTTTMARVDLDGRRLAGPWTLPPGQILSSPPRAVVGGVLTQSSQPAAQLTLSIWNPLTGHLSRVGPSRDVIDTYTAPGAKSTLVAYTASDCRTTGCGLVITRVPGGSPRRIVPPDGAPGFISGGAFSPDGNQLAVFVDRVPERVNPGGELVVVDVATATATAIVGSTVSFGEPVGFATWSPDGNWLYFGGLSPKLKVHYRDTPDAVEVALPAYYSAVAGAPSGRGLTSGSGPSS
jgi:hypothetical protein